MIERVYNALRGVQRVYLKYPAIGEIHKYGERVFAYEFYHQLRRNFDDLQMDITGEPIKGAGLLPDMEQTIIPDFVIHNYATNDHNEIAIEIKVTPKLTAKKVRDDLRKLADMINGPLGYNYGVFFVGNCYLECKIENSTLYYDAIIQIIEDNPNIIIWNTLPFADDTNMRDCISDNDIIQISRNNFE